MSVNLQMHEIASQRLNNFASTKGLVKLPCVAKLGPDMKKVKRWLFN